MERTVPISNRKVVERGQIDTSTTHIHDRSLYIKYTKITK